MQFRRVIALITSAMLMLPVVTYSLDTNYQSVSAISTSDVYFNEFDTSVNGGEPIRGVDISSILSVEASGVIFYDEDGNEQDIFKTLAENGVNYIRVRVWNNPYDSDGNSYGGGNCDVYNAAEIGRRAAQYGMKLLVDFQYSDFWADPEKQTVPKAWSDYTYAQKQQAIYDYTLESLQIIKSYGADIGMVQIGNETNNYFCGESDMYSISWLFSSGCSAVRAFDSSILIAVHFANPSTGYYDWYAQVLDECNVDYDVFATSYYPYWHGTTENLTSVLKNIGDTYNKYVMVAETAYPYTDDDGDGYGNEVLSTSSGVELRYDISVEGQAQCLTDVFQAIANVGSKGIGVFYWEPAWLGVDGLTWEEQSALWANYGSGWATSYASDYDYSATGTGGSSYDNQALFDFSGKPLDSLKVFNNIYPKATKVTETTTEATTTTVTTTVATTTSATTTTTEPITEPSVVVTEPITEPTIAETIPEPYEVANIANGTYKLKSVNSGLYLAETNGNAIQSAEQSWILTSLGDGVYTLQTSDYRTLTVENGSIDDGANISLQDFTGNDSQKFILRLNDDNTYSLLTMVSNGLRCVDVYGISLEDGANICQWEFWGGSGQKFTIEPIEETTITVSETTQTQPIESTQEPWVEDPIVTPLGDINYDGRVDLMDAFILKKYILGYAYATAEADINGDGVVNILDMVELKSIIINGIS